MSKKKKKRKKENGRKEMGGKPRVLQQWLERVR